MPSLENVPIPLTDPIAKPRKLGLKPNQKDPNEGKITEQWIPFFNSQQQNFIGVPKQTADPVSLSAQAATIALTPFPTGSLAGGLYRASFYAQITQVAPVSSSLIVTFSWQNLGQTVSLSSAAITGNLLTTGASGTLMVNIDSASPISYSTTYASVGGPPDMTYSLYLTLEAM